MCRARRRVLAQVVSGALFQGDRRFGFGSFGREFAIGFRQTVLGIFLGLGLGHRGFSLSTRARLRQIGLISRL